VIERGVILAPDDGPIDLSHLFTYEESINTSFIHLARDGSLEANTTAISAQPADPVQTGDTDLVSQFLSSNHSLDELEERLVDKALERTGGNVTKAAKLLGITRARLDYRVRKKETGEVR